MRKQQEKDEQEEAEIVGKNTQKGEELTTRR